MKQEEKQLLLRDLCARLPYGVKGNYQNSDDELLRKVTIMYGNLKPNGMVMTGDIKPYLFPLSSMTEEQKEEYNSECKKDLKTLSEAVLNRTYTKTRIETPLYYGIDWLNKNHFDYRGLIEKGLALDATDLNIY